MPWGRRLSVRLIRKCTTGRAEVHTSYKDMTIMEFTSTLRKSSDNRKGTNQRHVEDNPDNCKGNSVLSSTNSSLSWKKAARNHSTPQRTQTRAEYPQPSANFQTLRNHPHRTTQTNTNLWIWEKTVQTSQTQNRQLGRCCVMDHRQLAVRYPGR